MASGRPLPLPPLTGNMFVPCWALRPGSYTVLVPVADCMVLWLLLHSWTADAWAPCYFRREQLGMTLGSGKTRVSQQLGKLRKVGLLFEVGRGIEPKAKRHRPPARWALDPFKAEKWRPKVEASLVRVAEQDGHGGRWYQRAVQSLEAFERRSRVLGARIQEDMLVVPRPPRKRRKRREKAEIDPRQADSLTRTRAPRGSGPDSGPRPDSGHEGGGLPGGRGRMRKNGRPPPRETDGRDDMVAPVSTVALDPRHSLSRSGATPSVGSGPDSGRGFEVLRLPRDPRLRWADA